MTLPIIASTALALSVICIVAGVALTVRNASLDEARSATADAFAGPMAKLLESVAKLAEALASYPTGMQLVFLGLVFMLVSALTGSIAAVTG